ncbi:MAG: cytochrome c [Enhydrobacter sp.]|nr:cytochrome c [Enhydrobacter sp.]
MKLMLSAAAAFGCLLAMPALAQPDRVERGRVFAQANCAACHAIGRDGASPLVSAPPLRTLHRRYPVEYLTEALAEGITTGHPEMPQFKLDLVQIGDLIAYLKSLE